ncbi:hypothetical protein [Dyadobacter sp. NIV53]|uniref:hypothetical protein n=1 Tax=Dyadobacter sp. NIV53 TaxID=2861765 RepID=UPI001C88A29A|nr:hypothetical protein [Dyadobacter sp. NIV53]
MKNPVLAALFVTALITSKILHAQPVGLPAGPGPRPVAGAPAPGGPTPGAPSPGSPGLQAINTIQGKVVKLQGNDDFIFDGFYMLSAADSLLVKFPAHMGSQIFALTKPGSQVSVSGVVENARFGAREFRMVNLNAAGKTLTDTPPNTAPAPAQETAVTGNGKVTSFQTDREGRINGFFVDNKTVLRLPPHISVQMGNSISKGTAISYSGNQKVKAQGEIQLEDYKVVRCNTITVNGQQYLVR